MMNIAARLAKLGGLGQTLIASVATVSLLTFLANLLGFGRELLIARAFGATGTTDSFFAALSVVAMVFLVFTAGTLQAALIPRYVALRADGAEALATRLAKLCGYGLAMVLGLLSLAMFMFAPAVTRLAFPGFDEARQAFTSQQIRIMAPMILLVGLGAFLAAILNAHRRFWQAALVPALNNVIVIAGLLIWASAGAVVLAWGLLAGASLWIILLAPFALPLLAGPAQGAVGRDIRSVLIAFASIGGVTALDQIAAVFQKSLVSGYAAGLISALSYGARLVGLPMGILGLALVTVMLPAFVAALNTKRREDVSRVFATSLLGMISIILPITVILIVLAEPIVTVLLQRGAFDATATRNTALALQWYAVGLPAQVAMPLMTRLYFAAERPQVVFIIGAVAAVIWFGLTWMFVSLNGWVGVAQATAAYAYIHAAIQVAFLRPIVDLAPRPLLVAFARYLVAIVPLLAALYVSAAGSIWVLAAGAVIGSLGYLGALVVMGDRSILRLLQLKWS